ncbi:putative pectate lyase 6 [Hibiscus syriacus]|uniref:Pectate lyase n=1 Tax=Hibiscus syriacus TaxID=106335 RepID=A0A6A3CRQ0_HIBSY|nr:putative pectate lyase 6 [Hibiscus syriacus]
MIVGNPNTRLREASVTKFELNLLARLVSDQGPVDWTLKTIFITGEQDDEYDDYWGEHELKAKENLEKAYNPLPEEVPHHYNERASRERRRGFPVAQPTSSTNAGASIHTGKEIGREQELVISTDDKTIDGRGARVHIAYGAGISIHFARNIIIHNLCIHDIVSGDGGMIRDAESHCGVKKASDGDGISLFGATNVLIDHLSMYQCFDGLIDVIQGSTAITISNCHFTDHNDATVLVASDKYVEDEKMQVTVALNHFGKGLAQRMPRCRFGFAHVINNHYTHWIMSAISGCSHPTIISLGNRYRASSDKITKEVTWRNNAPQEVWKSWDWVSEGDKFVNGAFFTPSGNPNANKKFGGDKILPYEPGRKAPKLSVFSGALECKPGNPC